MKKVAIFAIAATLTSPAMSAGMDKACNVVACNAGDKAITYAKKDDMYFACPTMELSDYTNAVLGMVSLSALSGKMPNISPVTGEPEYEGQSKQMLDVLRAKARVATFDQAVAACKKGAGKRAVTVMNNPKDGFSIWVAGVDKKPFWMPKGHLDKR
jgi:hypothetical protein